VQVHGIANISRRHPGAAGSGGGTGEDNSVALGNELF